MATSPHAASPVALAPGATLQNGRYRIGAVLGQGGFGITYRATHPLHDDVVLKELFLSSPPFVCVRAAGGAVQPQFDAGQFERFRERFLEEARQLARLRAVPGVVDVLDYFEENGTAYFTMPFVSETTLQALAPLPEARALRYIEQVGEALATLHQQNVLHRDVKPSNILITPEDRAVLIDFGAARQFVENEISSQTAMYSPGYGAPEQAVPSARRGPFTDVFALAGTLYYCLSGHRPPTSQERDLSGFRPLRERVPTASPAVDAALTRALQLNPEQRFPTVAAFLAALQPGDDDATRAVPPGPGRAHPHGPDSQRSYPGTRPAGFGVL
jgi:serine/threonine protein kinase